MNHNIISPTRGTRFCTQCKGIDKTLTTHCPNMSFTHPVSFAIVDGEVDYFNGEWTGTTLALQQVEQQLFQKGYCYFPDNNHTSQVSTSTTSLYLDELGHIELGEEDEL